MNILFQDQAEFYFVCDTCHAQFADMQWAGSTRSPYKNWRKFAADGLQEHIAAGKPCEFCGPNGNGGWSIDGRWPAAERRDANNGGG